MANNNYSTDNTPSYSIRYFTLQCICIHATMDCIHTAQCTLQYLKEIFFVVNSNNAHDLQGNGVQYAR